MNNSVLFVVLSRHISKPLQCWESGQKVTSSSQTCAMSVSTTIFHARSHKISSDFHINIGNKIRDVWLPSMICKYNYLAAINICQYSTEAESRIILPKFLKIPCLGYAFLTV